MSGLRRAIAFAVRRYRELGRVMKAVSALTAIIGLVTATVHGYSAISEHVARGEAVTSFFKIANKQLAERDYRSAWEANAEALKLAPKDREARKQQAEIAMQWLENVRLSSKPGAKTFGDIVDPLEDALARRAVSGEVKGGELATLEAHIGWARFLRSRDGVTGLRVRETLDSAVKKDDANMYAHVIRGFVTLWTGGSVQDARADFDAALQSNVDPSYRDRMILAALFNVHTDEHQFAAIEYANKIRKIEREIDSAEMGDRAEKKERLLSFYEEGLSDPDYLARLAHVLPVDEHIANLDWILKEQTNRDRQHNGTVLKAYFMESAGGKSEALAVYREVAATSPEVGSRAANLARAGIKRLTQKTK